MLYTIEEVAALFKITRSHAYRLKKEQNWPHVMFGNSLRFTADDIQQIVAMNRKQQPTHEVPKRAPRIPKRK